MGLTAVPSDRANPAVPSTLTLTLINMSQYESSKVFDETVELDPEDDMEEITREAKYVSVANGTLEDIEVEIDEVTLVREVNKREKTFAIGASPLAGAANLKFSLGAVDRETFLSQQQAHNVGPHSLWRVPVDSSTMEANGQAINVKNSIQIAIYKGGLKKDKLGSFIVGPGHGIIVSRYNDRYQTEQAKSRSWMRRFDPWLNSMNTSRDPHATLARRGVCETCGFSKRKGK